MGRALEGLQSLGANSNSDVYIITAISIHLSPGKLQTTHAFVFAANELALHSEDFVGE
jgi:hypothetical protein